MKNNYIKLAIMLFNSFIIMYAVMFLNAAQLNHIYLSYTRFYMTLLMVAPMGLVMLVVMKNMYTNKKLNFIIIYSSIFIFIISLVLLRLQIPVSDEQYMKAMIPHHSSAILTSEEASLSNPKVKKLADEIIRTQKEEIALMKEYLHSDN